MNPPVIRAWQLFEVPATIHEWVLHCECGAVCDTKFLICDRELREGLVRRGVAAWKCDDCAKWNTVHFSQALACKMRGNGPAEAGP